MTQIDFYIINEGYTHSLDSMVCSLCMKALESKNRVYIQTEDEAHREQLAKLLYSLIQNSFLPHEMVEASPAPETPILLGWGELKTNESDILINLQPTVPPMFSQFSRVIEIIPTEEKMKIMGRERFRLYKSRGYSIQSHQLNPR